MKRVLSYTLFFSIALSPLLADNPDRDFTGDWILVPGSSHTAALGVESEPFLKVTQDDRAIRCSSAIRGADVVWSYKLDGGESRYTAAGESRNSAVKWEGASLLVNTLVSGDPNYTIMDRWRLSPDHATLTITRQVVGPRGESEGSLVYRRAGARPAETVPAASTPAAPAPAPILRPRPEAAPVARGEATVAAGTRVLVRLVSTLNTKKSRDGDRVYLRTAVPVAVDDRIVIPRGSDVAGSIVEVKGAKGRGDLYIRFDTLTLPDGTTRDLLARPDGGKEGKIAGAPNHAADIRKVAIGAGIGGAAGRVAGGIAGHGAAGMGIGALAGAVAGVAMTKRPDVTLPAGTTVEMVLDRDLKF